VSRVDCFVVFEGIVAEFPELIFVKFGTFSVVGAVEPVLRIPVLGLVVAFLGGSRDRTMVVYIPKLEVGYFVID